MTKRNLLDESTYEECLKRLDTITSETNPVWGSMTAAQMMAHCCEVQDVANGKDLDRTPLIARLMKGWIKKMVLDAQPYKEGTHTHPQYIQKGEKDFEAEKARLLNSLDTFFNYDKEVLSEIKHPLFGTMTLEEKGWAMYKHIDHHLRQFNA